MGDVTRDLDALARALAATGWASRPRYDEEPARLRVYDPATPRFGDTVHVADGPDGAPWFWSSTGAPLAPVWDLPRAVKRLRALVEAFRPVAEQFGMARPQGRHRRPRKRRWFRTG